MIYPGPRVEVYCRDCYGGLRERALQHIPDLPSFDELGKKAVDFNVPEYMIKDNSMFQLFFPSDPIDLGVLRQRRRRERGQTEGEKT